MSEFEHAVDIAAGVELSEMYNAKFADMDLDGYTAALKEPDGMSTEGGKQATQHMVLVPQTTSAATITIGSVNMATKVAKLRTHDCMKALFKQRFPNQPFVVQPGGYQRFFDACRDFLVDKAMQVEIVTRPPPLSVPPTARSAGGTQSGRTAFLVLLAATLIVSAILYYLRSQGQLRF